MSTDCRLLMPQFVMRMSTEVSHAVLSHHKCLVPHVYYYQITTYIMYGCMPSCDCAPGHELLVGRSGSVPGQELRVRVRIHTRAAAPGPDPYPGYELRVGGSGSPYPSMSSWSGSASGSGSIPGHELKRSRMNAGSF